MDFRKLFDKIVTLFRTISDALGIQWAPLNIPISRRLQTLAAFGWICLPLFGEGLTIYLYIKLLYSSYWWLALLYAVWMLNDVEICQKGGRTCEWVRNWSWWRYYCDYFPLKLVKTTELDPSRNYLFACFPHGLLCAGAYGSFATNALGFYKLFPGMSCNLIILAGHFMVPLFREYLLSLGMCSSSRESLRCLLDTKQHRGKCVALMIGGAAEALDSHPGEYKIILSRRQGFIRIAMSTGAPIVPVISFGETDVFRPLNNPEDSWLRKFQEKVRQVTGISPMFPIGRGLLQYSYGFVPLRTPVTTVVGSPMEVVKNLEPTDEEVNRVHAEFKRHLVELFESEKSKYIKNSEDVHLIIT